MLIGNMILKDEHEKERKQKNFRHYNENRKLLSGICFNRVLGEILMWPFTYGGPVTSSVKIS